MLIENIKEAFQNLLSNKMRSLLTMLGIIIGISAVITITTIGTCECGRNRNDKRRTGAHEN